MSSLDARDPLVLDTRELGRRPGSMKRVTTTVPAPEGLGIAVLTVPAGSELALDLRLEAVVEGVLVSGSVEARVEGDCVRCLEPLEQELDVDLQQLYVYPGHEQADDEEDDLLVLAGDLLDLRPPLRDALVLALPLKPLCAADCPGLCVECGTRLDDGADHAHETVDVRWAALVGMLENTPSETSSESTPDASSKPHNEHSSTGSRPVDRPVDTQQEK